MDRRQFLRTTAATGLALSAGRPAFADDKTYRVGLIGTGWYGKADLLRLILPAAAGHVVQSLDRAVCRRRVACHAARGTSVDLRCPVHRVAVLHVPAVGIFCRCRRSAPRERAPYLMVVHGLLDTGAAYLVLEASRVTSAS